MSEVRNNNIQSNQHLNLEHELLFDVNSLMDFIKNLRFIQAKRKYNRLNWFNKLFCDEPTLENCAHMFQVPNDCGELIKKLPANDKQISLENLSTKMRIVHPSTFCDPFYFFKKAAEYHHPEIEDVESTVNSLTHAIIHQNEHEDLNKIYLRERTKSPSISKPPELTFDTLNTLKHHLAEAFLKEYNISTKTDGFFNNSNLMTIANKNKMSAYLGFSSFVTRLSEGTSIAHIENAINLACQDIKNVTLTTTLSNIISPYKMYSYINETEEPYHSSQITTPPTLNTEELNQLKYNLATHLLNLYGISTDQIKDFNYSQLINLSNIHQNRFPQFTQPLFTKFVLNLTNATSLTDCENAINTLSKVIADESIKESLMNLTSSFVENDDDINQTEELKPSDDPFLDFFIEPEESKDSDNADILTESQKALDYLNREIETSSIEDRLIKTAKLNLACLILSYYNARLPDYLCHLSHDQENNITFDYELFKSCITSRNDIPGKNLSNLFGLFGNRKRAVLRFLENLNNAQDYNSIKQCVESLQLGLFRSKLKKELEYAIEEWDLLHDNESTLHLKPNVSDNDYFLLQSFIEEYTIEYQPANIISTQTEPERTDRLSKTDLPFTIGSSTFFKNSPISSNIPNRASFNTSPNRGSFNFPISDVTPDKRSSFTL